MAKLKPGSKVFISYAHEDADYVRGLTSYLKERGIPFWYDQDRLQPGSKFNRKIKDAIDACSGFVLIMTPASEASDYVEEERDRAERQDKEFIPFLVEGETHFGTATRNYVDLEGGRMPPDDVVEHLRSLTRPPTSVTPSYKSFALPRPTPALSLGDRHGVARFIGETGPEASSVSLVGGEDGQSQRVLAPGVAVEQLMLSPDGSLIAVKAGKWLSLAEVGGDGLLSPWDLRFDLTAHFGVSDRAVLVGLGRSTSRFDPCADLLIEDSTAVRRYRVDRAGRWRSSPGVPGSGVVRAAAVGEGYLALVEGGDLLAIGRQLESLLGSGRWSDIDAAVGQPRSAHGSSWTGGADGDAVELVAAVRVVDGDAQLIAWRRPGGGSVEVRGLDLELDGEDGEACVDVVRPRAGGEPERVLVTAGRHTLGWSWNELVAIDPDMLATAAAHS